MPTPLVFSGFEKAAAGAPRFLLKAIRGASPDKALRGYKQLSQETGTGSFLLAPPLWVAEKTLGKERVQNAIWKGYTKPLLMADTYLGHQASKVPLLGKVFKETTKIPWGKDGAGLYKEVARDSLTAPLGKARDFIEPFLVASGLERGYHTMADALQTRKARQQDAMMEPPRFDTRNYLDPSTREKVASTMLRLHESNKEHEKRAQAIRILFKKSESGVEAMPQSYSEFETKLASIMGQDMAILERAMELTSGNTDMGSLEEDTQVKQSAEVTFQSECLGFK